MQEAPLLPVETNVAELAHPLSADTHTHDIQYLYTAIFQH